MPGSLRAVSKHGPRKALGLFLRVQFADAMGGDAREKWWLVDASAL